MRDNNCFVFDDEDALLHCSSEAAAASAVAAQTVHLRPTRHGVLCARYYYNTNGQEIRLADKSVAVAVNKNAVSKVGVLQ